MNAGTETSWKLYVVRIILIQTCVPCKPLIPTFTMSTLNQSIRIGHPRTYPASLPQSIRPEDDSPSEEGEEST